MRHVLITGGAGFLGAHISAELLRAGYRVRLLDSLHPQIHGGSARPAYLPADAELVIADLRDHDAVRAALHGVDSVIHLAARVGVGQSMYELAEYSGTNTFGTAVLLQELLSSKVERAVVASSMSVYGEGRYVDADRREQPHVYRSREQLIAGRWDPLDQAGRPLVPVPTPERSLPSPNSVYALDKYYQERACIIFGETYGVNVTALRLFNVYGPYQALSNPYTGVLVNFAVRILHGRPPLIFEDGKQRRDFVSVHDVARAFRLALESESSSGQVVNVAGGRDISVGEAAGELAEALGRPDLRGEVTSKYRVGDIRHCIADISLAGQVLGYRPETDFSVGVRQLVHWLERQVAEDRLELMAEELGKRGLAIGPGAPGSPNLPTTGTTEPKDRLGHRSILTGGPPPLVTAVEPANEGQRAERGV